MSRRTAEANNAIRIAWQQEKERVLVGKGTRDWTPEQQKDIIEKGKAYDADGRAFEGQHMKSVETNPDYQGDPNNIQFLTREEHLAAHDGNWQNPTNWYYDPQTREKHDFGEGQYEPCKVINLSEPITTPKPNPSQESTYKKSFIDSNSDASPTHINTNPKQPIVKKGFWRRTGEAIVKEWKETKDAFLRSFSEHPFQTIVLLVTGAVEIGSKVGSIRSSHHSAEKNRSSTSYPVSTNIHRGVKELEHDEIREEVQIIQRDETLMNDSNDEKRASPCKHTVRESEQTYHTKEGVIKKRKDPYTRGKD